MKKPFLIILLLPMCFITKAQNNSNKSSARIDTNTIVDPIEPTPSFPGGQKAWNKFLATNLKWPDGIDGQEKVVIGFIVERNGNLTNIKVIKKLGPEFDKEALRVVQLSPRWTPAKLKGKSIRCRFYVPIDFKMSD